LRDLIAREKIEADEDALALLAEAGDGSIRDALSILDQTIASSSGKLTAESVRNLVGAAPGHILEDVLRAVSEGKSNEILAQVDHLISEGHSPTHFARQMVRFLRNATVAKVAGPESALLQISSEERARVARVAELFGEEDLTRHLQIMLRTHGELGYKQEQRFHLELGLLRMAHAQRLLPVEQLLSEVANAQPSNPQRIAGKPTIVGSGAGLETRSAEPRRPEAPGARSNYVSPFAADAARKGTPRQEDSATPVATGPRIVAASSHPEPVVLGSAAPDRTNAGYASAPAPAPMERGIISAAAPEVSGEIENLQTAVLQALSDNNQRILVSMLSAGEWNVVGNELVVKVAESQTILDMSLGTEAKRIATAAASGALGRAVKLRVVAGAAVGEGENSNKQNGSTGQLTPGPGGRGRAEQDPIVRRMREKFGAEIRTVIDYREKR
jgi:DNA polymerase III subunit gamma/tau